MNLVGHFDDLRANFANYLKRGLFDINPTKSQIILVIPKFYK